MRRKFNMAATLALILAITANGCGKPGGTSPDSGQTGASGANGASTPGGGGVTAAVQTKLKGDVDLAEVKVSEQNGSIQLDGNVKDSATKDKAEKIVMDVEKEQKSQVGVLNNLQIKEAGAAK